MTYAISVQCSSYQLNHLLSHQDNWELVTNVKVNMWNIMYLNCRERYQDSEWPCQLYTQLKKLCTRSCFNCAHNCHNNHVCISLTTVQIYNISYFIRLMWSLYLLVKKVKSIVLCIFSFTSCVKNHLALAKKNNTTHTFSSWIKQEINIQNFTTMSFGFLVHISKKGRVHVCFCFVFFVSLLVSVEMHHGLILPHLPRFVRSWTFFSKCSLAWRT